MGQDTLHARPRSPGLQEMPVPGLWGKHIDACHPLASAIFVACGHGLWQCFEMHLNMEKPREAGQDLRAQECTATWPSAPSSPVHLVSP